MKARVQNKITKIPVLKQIFQVATSIRQFGFTKTARRIKRKLRRLPRVFDTGYELSAAERDLQTGYVFPKQILISILVPVYNTPLTFLEELLDSVLAQTYPNWQLCLADASDPDYTKVGELCQKFQADDPRINYKKLDSNQGISGNTNQCLAMANGDYFALLDHDDILHPSALYEVMQVICSKEADMIYTDEAVFKEVPQKPYLLHLKSDYAPDTLRSYNYICHLTVFSQQLQNKVGVFDPELDGSQDFDMVLRLSEQASKIVHIPKVLYYWRSHVGSVAGGVGAKMFAITAAKQALSNHLCRVGLKAAVEDSSIPSIYKIKYEIEEYPLISIIIPNKDHIKDLDNCLKSIQQKTTYPNYEILIVENNSTDPKTFDYYKTLECYKTLPSCHSAGGTAASQNLKEEFANIKILTYTGDFNFSMINNFGASQARGEYLLFLNNDTEVITPDWLQEMLMFAQRQNVGAVGAMLYYPDNTVQHAGIILGIAGFAGHSHKAFKRDSAGFMGRLAIAQNVTAVTGACMMMRKDVFDRIGGLDEQFAVALNDVDICLQARQLGLLNVFTPFAELYHYESKSRGYETTPQKQARAEDEIGRFKQRWHTELENGDPYYNPNLTLVRQDFSVRDTYELK